MKVDGGALARKPVSDQEFEPRSFDTSLSRSAWISEKILRGISVSTAH
jgi:hypothetical protein